MRSFIASPVENESDFSTVLESLSAFPEINPVPLNNLHLTFLFLADINDKQRDEAIELLKEINYRKIRSRILSVDIFPEKSRPHVVVLKIDNKDIMELNNMIQNSFSTRFNPNLRFLAHVTVGRFRKHAIPVDLESIKIDATYIEFNRVCLYKSTLAVSGSVYEKLYCRHL